MQAVPMLTRPLAQAKQGPPVVYWPSGQGAQSEAADEPASEEVPTGHWVALREPYGQKDPTGHSTGAPEKQKKEAGQGRQASWRTLKLPKSAITTAPVEGFIAREKGEEKRALVPIPSANAAPVPVTVDTMPAGVMMRTPLLSVTNTRPPESTAMPANNQPPLLNLADVPTPSAKPVAKHIPARVDTCLVLLSIIRTKEFRSSDT